MAQFNETKHLYQDVFFPPEGYDYDFAQLTTYSLSKRQLMLIFAMALSAKQRRGTLHRPRSTIRATRENPAPLFHLLYDQAHQLELSADPDEYRSAVGKLSLYLFEHCCTGVDHPSGLFHPKIILVQFKKQGAEGDYYYRALISSKNLTGSNYFEAGVLLESCGKLESAVSGEEPDHRVGPALARFFQKHRPDGGIDLTALAGSAFRVVGAETSEPELYFGSEGSLRDLIQADLDSQTAPKTHLRITSMNPTEGLFTLAEGQKVEYICNFKDFYSPDPQNNSVWNGDPAKETDHWYVGKPAEAPKALHAKQYLLWQRKNRYFTNLSVWIGSANCSGHALCRKNEEVLVHYTQACDVQEENSFPCKGPSGAEFCTSSQPGLLFHHPKSVTDPEIPECGEDDFPVLRVKVTSAKYVKESETLVVTLANQTGKTIFVRPATFSEKAVFTLPFGSNAPLFFPSMTAKNFSPLLLVRADGEDRVYGLPLNIPWEGEDINALCRQLPLDAVTRFADLIAEPSPKLFTAGNDVYERLQKCRMKQSAEEFRHTVQMAYDDLAACLTEPDPDEGNLDLTAWENFFFFEKHRAEAHALSELLLSLGAQEVQYG